ncbi:MAG: hypothetical protein M3119_00830 [Verrucomicrobiota bacterium]|nr:hypothetical protein [Verrucomicrobiota bacterium]MDQ6938681.1 hypothetical protein [Verrucomicrobiota bacterium]
MSNEEKDRSERTHQAEPTHVPGTNKGEEQALTSKEAGREAGRKNYQDARDSTGINAAARQPIAPGMPNIPPA